MTVYYDFEGIRMHAEVDWPKNTDTINVTLTDKRLKKDFPSDLLYDLTQSNKVTYNIENPRHKRLVELQKVIGKRLQEIAGHM